MTWKEIKPKLTRAEFKAFLDTDPPVGVGGTLCPIACWLNRFLLPDRYIIVGKYGNAMVCYGKYGNAMVCYGDSGSVSFDLELPDWIAQFIERFDTRSSGVYRSRLAAAKAILKDLPE